MKPTITANLGGTEFIFETDAYELMEQYLSSLREAFNARQLDTNDLLADIEARCAEILSEPRADGSRIVTIIFVRHLIGRMGQPQEIFDEEVRTTPPPPPTHGNTAPTPFSTTPPPISKRLYRDPQNKLLGGVCAGIAIYSGWDPVWVRLAAVGLAFLSFNTMALVYIILWIVLKPANTPYQQMQLRGVSPTLQNIGNAVTGTFHSVKNYIGHSLASATTHGTAVDSECEFEQLMPEAQPQKATGVKRIAQVITEIASVFFKILLGLFGLVCIPVLIGLVTAMVVIISLPNLFTMYGSEIGDPEIVSLMGNMPLLMWVMVSAIIFFGIPAVAMIWMLCRLFMGRRAKPVPVTSKIIMLVLWIASIFSLAVCSLCQYPLFHIAL